MTKRKKPFPTKPKTCPTCGAEDPKDYKPAVDRTKKMGDPKRYCPDPSHGVRKEI